MSHLLQDECFQELKNVKDLSSEEFTPYILSEWIRTFYDNTWVYSRYGAIGVIHNDLLFITPSNITEDNMDIESNFVFDITAKKLIYSPPDTELSESAHIITYLMRTTACSAVIYTCSAASVELSGSQEGTNVLTFTQKESMKGVYDSFLGTPYEPTDTLAIPIMDDDEEGKFLTTLKELFRYPVSSCAVLVRGRGMYVWGRTWEQAKRSCECIESILEEELLFLSALD